MKAIVGNMIICFSALCWAGDWFPLSIGNEWTYDYYDSNGVIIKVDSAIIDSSYSIKKWKHI